MSDSTQPENSKYKSRKWIVTMWAMAMASLIILAVLAGSFTGYDVPDGAITLAGVLSSTAIAYIGGNTYAKTHAKEQS